MSARACTHLDQSAHDLPSLPHVARNRFEGFLPDLNGRADRKGDLLQSAGGGCCAEAAADDLWEEAEDRKGMGQ